VVISGQCTDLALYSIEMAISFTASSEAKKASNLGRYSLTSQAGLVPRRPTQYPHQFAMACGIFVANTAV
jgi:hypothetical protein